MDYSKSCLKAVAIGTCCAVICLLVYFPMSYLRQSAIAPKETNITVSGNETLSKNEIDIDDLDTSADLDPCKDFFQFACGSFIAENPPRSGSNRIRRDNAVELEDKRIGLVEIKQFLKTCLDDSWENEAKETRSLEFLVKQLGGWQLLQPEALNSEDFDWVKTAAEVRRSTGNSAIINVDVLIKTENNKSFPAFQVGKPSLGLPLETLNNPSNDKKNYALLVYKNFIYSSAKLLGSTLDDTQLHTAVHDIANFEMRLAKISKESGNVAVPKRLDSIPGAFINEFIEVITKPYGIVIGKNESIWIEYEFFEKLLEVLKDEKKETVANYVVWRFISGLISEKTPSLYRLRQRLSDDLGENGKAVDKGESFCVDQAKNVLRRTYIEQKVDPDTKEELEWMTIMILKAFKAILNESELDSEAKEVLNAHIDKTRYIIDEKERAEEYYEGLELTESYVENQVRISRFLFGKDDLKMLKGDADLPAMYDRGAAYSIFFNVIYISPALLQPPFFGGRRPKHQNYARLGSYIAHEIAHSLQVSVSPTFPNGWSEFAKTLFKKEIKCAADTFGEFWTDMNGLRVSWRAYQKYVYYYGSEIELKGLEQFTIEQLFFLGYAKAHCESITNEAFINQIKADPHSPAEFKVNGILKHFGEFAKAFNCAVDANGMNPPEKCVDW